MGLFNFFRNTADINTGVAEYEKTDGSVLLDVRTPEEYRDGHIDGSINLLLIEFLSLRMLSKTKMHNYMSIVTVEAEASRL